MRVRGRRECRDCGTQWSYYETGSVTCPSCGSVHSRGLDDERTLHTAGSATLDLTPVREAIDERPLVEVLEEAKSECREYARQTGFVRGGELLPLGGTLVAALEVVHVADVVGRRRAPDDDERLYLLELLRAADRGERPEPAAVPASLRAARGLAVADAVRDYRRDLREWLEEHPDPEGRRLLGRLADHDKRVRALQGDVPPARAEALLSAARALGDALADGDGVAGGDHGSARERLDALDDLEDAAPGPEGG